MGGFGNLSTLEALLGNIIYFAFFFVSQSWLWCGNRFCILSLPFCMLQTYSCQGIYRLYKHLFKKSHKDIIYSHICLLPNGCAHKDT